jgi:hypothetical protein
MELLENEIVLSYFKVKKIRRFKDHESLLRQTNKPRCLWLDLKEGDVTGIEGSGDLLSFLQNK